MRGEWQNKADTNNKNSMRVASHCCCCSVSCIGKAWKKRALTMQKEGVSCASDEWMDEYCHPPSFGSSPLCAFASFRPRTT